MSTENCEPAGVYRLMDEERAKKTRVIGMLRVKNEEEYIERTIRMAAKVADGFVILDDGSTDRTPELCRSLPKVLRYEYQNEPVKDEARDKDRLLQWTLAENPDWILALDGDEIIEDIGPFILRREIADAPPDVSVFTFNFLYMWDSHDRYRVDGHYASLRHPRLFRVSGLGIDPRMLSFARTGNGANFHCGSVPANIPGSTRHLDLNVKHYGYFSQAQRESKLAFYTTLDPVNANSGLYRHLTDGEGLILQPWRERNAGEVAWSATDSLAPDMADTGTSPHLPVSAAKPLVAIVYGHTPFTVGRMFKSALGQMKAEFVSVGWFGGSRIGWPTERLYEKEIDIPDIIVGQANIYKASYIVSQVENARGRRPDMILQIDGDIHVCNDLGFKDIRFVSIATDPHVKSLTYEHAARCSAHFYCMQSGYMPLFGGNTRYVAYGYDPEIHHVEPAAEKKYDVSCIGFQFPQRVEMGDRLRRLGLNVRFENGPVLDEYRRILNESWICFNLSAADDLNMRVFETLACGTLLVSNVTTDMGRFFREGVDYVSYRTLDEAVEKILHYLKNKDQLAAIARSGHEAVQGHTYANRLKQIFRETGFDFMPARPGADGGQAGASGPVRPLAELPGYYQHIRPEILAAVPTDAKRILDVGCGAGLLGKTLKNQDPARRVVGIELDHDAFEHARLNLDQSYHAEVESFPSPFRNGQFDCVIFADVLEHLRNPWRIARTYASYLRPDGTFIASIPNIRFLPFLANLAINGFWKYQDEGILDNSHLRFFSRDEFLRLLDFAGIRCDAVRYLGTGRCAHLRPADPERTVKCGNMTLSGVSDGDFAEMSAFQMLFIGSYRPYDDPVRQNASDATAEENDLSAFAGYSRYVDELYDKASRVVAMDKFREAIPILKKLLSVSPNHVAAHNDLGLIYFDQGEKEKAIEHFGACARLRPGDAEAINNLANISFEMGKPDEAIDYYQDLVSLNPKDSDSLANLGNLHYVAGRKEIALSLYSQALAINPLNDIASRGMAALGR